MNRFLIGVLAGALALAGATATAEEPSPGEIQASALVGSPVANVDGKRLGAIAGVLLDSRPLGQHYALLSMRADDGEEKRFAYPVNAFRRAGADASLVLNVPLHNLEVSPGYQDGRGWPSPEVREGDRYVRARDVIGKAVVDPLGNRVGTLEDVALDLQTGRMRYATIHFAGGGRLPVAGHAIRLSPGGPSVLDPDSQRRS